MLCNTKYPILLVHGAGGRDHKHPNYWGRLPAALEAGGATVFYGRQDAWGTIEHNAKQLKTALETVLATAKSEKVNIIAHSKGGLDARFMISSLGLQHKVASLTTVATTHHGSKSIDRLIRVPKWMHKTTAFFVNLFCRATGDKNPDFYTASCQLSTGFMKGFNAQNPDAPQVYYQSWAAVMKHRFSDFFMLIPYLFVFATEGECDGLVTPDSATWSNFKGVIRGATGRGISHADEVDFRRINFTRKPVAAEGVTDIRRFYVDVVSLLREMGY